MNDAKQDGMQHMKGRLGEVLKKKWKNKVMHGQYIRNMDRQLISEEDTFLLAIERRLKSRNRERNSGSTRPSVKHEVLRHKNTTHRDR